jgi:hypothetical protein
MALISACDETLRLWMAIGFALCASVNIVGGGVVVLASRDWCKRMGEVNPLFGPLGFVGIHLWGAAYLTQVFAWSASPFTSLLFALEKLFYVVVWVSVLASQKRRGEAVALLTEQPMSGVFFLSFGVFDAISMAFFVAAFVIGLDVKTC